MKLGIALPHLGPIASREAIATVAVQAEQMGFAGLWVLERVLNPVHPEALPAGASYPFFYTTAFDPIETLAYAAAVTSTIALGTSVLDALFHPPVVLARRLATLDQLSGGRVIAGLGQGYMPEEFRTTNIPMSRRGRGFEEYIEALRATWGPDPVAYKGRFYDIPESLIGPKPVQPNGPKILLGGNVPVAIERAARIADGFNPVGTDPALRQNVARFRRAATEAGRNGAGLPVIARATILLTATDSPGTKFLNGSMTKIRDDLQSIEDLELDQVFFDFAYTPMESVTELLRVMEQLLRISR
jgi:probable F420-dependent oxidoreductase